ALASGKVDMPFEQRHDGRFIFGLQRIEIYHFHIAIVPKRAFEIIYPCNAAAHPGGEVTARRTQYQGTAARHVFATMVTHTFHDCRCTRVAYSKSFAGLPAYKEVARSSPV